LAYDALVDTDVLIWYLRGNPKAYTLIHSLELLAISSITYMELIQGMRNKTELRHLKQTLKQWRTRTLFVDTEISARALVYAEEYFLNHSMQLADALIAATATHHALTLHTANAKHYRTIRDLEITVFRP
jgi:predicted nucleic acid-binding protein